MRAIYYRESFEGNSRKFSKFENENEGNIFESFGIPNLVYIDNTIKSRSSIKASLKVSFSTNSSLFMLNESFVY